MTLAEVTSTILSGTVDNGMREVELAIRQRKEYLKNCMMLKLRTGDTVRISNIRPKRLCGLEAVVTKVNRTTISVKFGPEAGRHAGACRVPASCCEKV